MAVIASVPDANPTARRVRMMRDQLSRVVRGRAHRLTTWLLVGFALLYLWPTWLLASRRLLWNDELYTLYVSRQPSVSAIWAFLKTGASQHSPFFFVVTRAALGLFGESELVLRLPEVLGFGLMSLCIFHLVARRTNALYGAVAMLFPLTTGAYRYAFEARPYGLVGGLASLALLAWQRATEAGRRRLALAGLAASLAGAVSMHYYAVLLLVPLGLAEVVRTACRGRLDRAVWAAFGAALLPLLAVLPVIEGARSYSAHFWAKPSWHNITDAYATFLPRWPHRATLLLVAAWWILDRWRRADGSARTPAPPLPEIVAVLGYAALPAVTWGIAVTITGANTARYSFPVVIGLAVTFGWVSHRLLSRSAWSGAALVALLGVTFVVASVRHEAGLVKATRDQYARTYAFLEAHHRDGLPIVVERVTMFLSLAHYAPSDLAGYLVYLADPGIALRDRKTDTADRGILTLRHWAPVNAQEYRAFLARRRPFLVLGVAREPRRDWLFGALVADGVSLEREAQDGTDVLFLARSGG